MEIFLKNQNTQLQEKNLLGNIKSIKELSYFGKVIKEEKYADLWEEMNSVGLPSESFFINEKTIKGKLEKIDYASFDDRGNLIEETSCNPDDIIISKITHLYDKKGRKIETIYYDSFCKIKYKEVYKYDWQRNKTRETGFDSSGKPISILTLTYDQNGNLLKEIENRLEGTYLLIREYSYKFDSNNNIIEKTCSLNGSIIDIGKYTYKLNGDIIDEHTYYNEDGELSYSDTAITNKEGRYLKDQNNSTYEYDDKGNILKINHCMLEDTIVNYVYVYDNLNNWINRIEKHSNTNHLLITEREIVYYNNDIDRTKWWKFFR